MSLAVSTQPSLPLLPLPSCSWALYVLLLQTLCPFVDVADSAGHAAGACGLNEALRTRKGTHVVRRIWVENISFPLPQSGSSWVN